MEQEGGSAVWIFVWKLKDEEVQSQSTIHAAERGDEEPGRKRFFRQLQQRIECLQDNYNTGCRNAFLNVSIFVTIVWFLPSSNVHF